jgi:Metallo-beta-lactamase superfamily
MPLKSKVHAETKRIEHYRVRIRMYRQGLGDCFLLSFPQSDGKVSHMLIDCGVVLGTSEPGTVMTKVAEDVRAETDGNIDVLVITHEHWDHLSGFDQKQARAVFTDVTIGELWLAWTEDETDNLARSLRQERERKKAAAKAAMEAAKKLGRKERAQRLAEVLGLFGASAVGETSAQDEEGGGTAGALDFLKKKCQPTIIETGRTYDMPKAKGVRIYVLGPPKDDEAMRKTNPYKGEGYGLGGEPIGLADAFLAGFDPKDETAQPFAKDIRRSLKTLKAASRRRAGEIAPGIGGYYRAESNWRNIDEAWLSTGERLALQLDNATNNTSLVMAIELEDKDVILFVGDAQAGNWRSWETVTWKVKTGGGERRRVTSADLLKRTIFYKVGHHGSHNATLKEKGLELMKSNQLAACIPVDTNVAHEVKGWEHMPLPAIRERLDEKCAVIFQSDMKTIEKRRVPGATWKESTQQFDVRMKDKRTKKMKTVRKEHLYVDYFV